MEWWRHHSVNALHIYQWATKRHQLWLGLTANPLEMVLWQLLCYWQWLPAMLEGKLMWHKSPKARPSHHSDITNINCPLPITLAMSTEEPVPSCNINHVICHHDSTCWQERLPLWWAKTLEITILLQECTKTFNVQVKTNFSATRYRMYITEYYFKRHETKVNDATHRSPRTTQIFQKHLSFNWKKINWFIAKQILNCPI